MVLRSPGGVHNSLLAEARLAQPVYTDTELLQQCPYIQTVLQQLECDKTSVRLLRLDSGARIKEHRDTGLNFEEGEARIHIPVCTHSDLLFYIEQDRIVMQEGTCWYMNASLPHRVENPTPVHRIHLVADCVVNDWLRTQFEREDLLVKSVSDAQEAAEQQAALQQQVIAELRRTQDPIRMQMAAQLEQQLQAQNNL